MKRYNQILVVFVLVAMILSAGCDDRSAPLESTIEQQPVDTESEISASVETVDAGLTPLDALPMEVGIRTEDGVDLKGFYYPAAVNPAPIVVLMHWVNSDQNDWLQVALWLQNRGMTGSGDEGYYGDWHDPSWFPVVPANRSYGVLIFSYRYCTGIYGCNQIDEAGWLLDSKAAIAQAASLPGVDPQKIVAIGASIGADGAADACAWLNDQFNGAFCVGALSLSPGNYLTVDYAMAVESLESDTPPVPAWCLYATDDEPAKMQCTWAIGTLYRAYEYPSNNHGMQLLMPSLDPMPMLLILDFLYQVTGQ